jgi:hypothetical protein
MKNKPILVTLQYVSLTARCRAHKKHTAFPDSQTYLIQTVPFGSIFWYNTFGTMGVPEALTDIKRKVKKDETCSIANPVCNDVDRLGSSGRKAVARRIGEPCGDNVPTSNALGGFRALQNGNRNSR